MGLILVLLGSSQALASDLTAGEKRGRIIYLKTVSPSGSEISATVGKGGIEAPGSALACVNCHGFEGEGMEEHGISATNITWEDLSKPYWTKRSGPRQYPPYNEETLGRAIREGIDPAGNVLDASMPRYRLSKKDFEDLIAYLKVIRTALDPGLTDSSIMVGSVLPTAGPLESMGLAMKKLLEAYFDDINASGGVFNRRIVLHVWDYDKTRESIGKEYEKLFDEVFAIVSPLVFDGKAQLLSALAETRQVPVIGPLTLYPNEIQALNRYTFYIYSGLNEQARAQVTFAQKRFGNGKLRAAIVYPEDEAALQTAKAIEEQAVTYGWQSIERVPFYPNASEWSTVISRLEAENIGVLFFLGHSQDLNKLAKKVEKSQWRPSIFISGAQVRPDIFDLPDGFRGKVFASYPTLPSDYTEEGMRRLERLWEKYRLSRNHATSQISALCSAELLLEGLKRAGAKPSREKLVSVLDQLDGFKTGLAPEMSFNPNRRIGSLGAYIVTVDFPRKTLSPMHGWVPLD